MCKSKYGEKLEWVLGHRCQEQKIGNLTDVKLAKYRKDWCNLCFTLLEKARGIWENLTRFIKQIKGIGFMWRNVPFLKKC